MACLFDFVFRRVAVLCFVLALAILPAMGEDAFDPGRVTGPEIQTYRDQYIPQTFPSPARGWFYADVAVLAALLAGGTWLVRTRRPARWIGIQLAMALLYFGVFRGGCICPVGSTANVLLGLSHPELVGLATASLFLIPLGFALITGRVFCGSVCPLGAVQQLLAPKAARPLPRFVHRALLAIPVLLLAATAGAVWTGHGFLPCHLDPYKPLFFQSHAVAQKLSAWMGGIPVEPGWIAGGNLSMWGFLAIALLAGWFIPRIFCRYVCPYSFLLGALAAVGFWRRQIDAESCASCGVCVKECPVQAIERTPEGVKLSSYQCVQCGRCATVCKRGAFGPVPAKRAAEAPASKSV